MLGPVTRRRRPGISRRSLSLLVGLIVAATSLSIAGPAAAKDSTGPGQPAGDGCDANVPGTSALCHSGVTFSVNGNSNATVPGPSDAPIPGCWFEPSTFFTPTALKFISQVPVVSLLMPLLMGADTGTNGDFHDGQKGGWYEFVYNPAMPLPEAQVKCDVTMPPLLEWVPDATTPPGNAVSAWKMAKAAEKVLPVATPTLTLRPGAGNQVVNLPTLVSLDTFQRTFVTASLKVNGFALAATTIATPVSITVNAGTADASPSSCTYTLGSDGGKTPSFQIDPNSTHCSDGSSGSNAGIVYRRPTAAGNTYPLTASVTWNVTWTDTDNPDSLPQNPLGSLTLTSPPTPVKVNEIESINH
jgi:hypothetical protein